MERLKEDKRGRRTAQGRVAYLLLVARRSAVLAIVVADGAGVCGGQEGD